MNGAMNQQQTLVGTQQQFFRRPKSFLSFRLIGLALPLGGRFLLLSFEREGEDLEFRIQAQSHIINEVFIVSGPRAGRLGGIITF